MISYGRFYVTYLVGVSACSMWGGDKSARRRDFEVVLRGRRWELSPPLETNIISIIEHISEYTLSCTKPEKLNFEIPKTDIVSGSNRLPRSMA
jgi:hypothetical protein